MVTLARLVFTRRAIFNVCDAAYIETVWYDFFSGNFMIWAFYFEHHVKATYDNTWVIDACLMAEVTKTPQLDKYRDALNTQLMWRDTWFMEISRRARHAYVVSSLKAADHEHKTANAERRWRK